MCLFSLDVPLAPFQRKHARLSRTWAQNWAQSNGHCDRAPVEWLRAPEQASSECLLANSNACRTRGNGLQLFDLRPLWGNASSASALALRMSLEKGAQSFFPNLLATLGAELSFVRRSLRILPEASSPQGQIYSFHHHFPKQGAVFAKPEKCTICHKCSKIALQSREKPKSAEF